MKLYFLFLLNWFNASNCTIIICHTMQTVWFYFFSILICDFFSFSFFPTVTYNVIVLCGSWTRSNVCSAYKKSYGTQNHGDVAPALVYCLHGKSSKTCCNEQVVQVIPESEYNLYVIWGSVNLLYKNAYNNIFRTYIIFILEQSQFFFYFSCLFLHDDRE